jgi:hypothetical protein
MEAEQATESWAPRIGKTGMAARKGMVESRQSKQKESGIGAGEMETGPLWKRIEKEPGKSPGRVCGR